MKYCVFILLFSLFSCVDRNNNTIKSQKVIVIQLLGNFQQKQSQKVFAEIKAINPRVVLKANIEFPEKSYYKPRNRYRADSIIKNLKKQYW